VKPAKPSACADRLARVASDIRRRYLRHGQPRMRPLPRLRPVPRSRYRTKFRRHPEGACVL